MRPHDRETPAAAPDEDKARKLAELREALARLAPQGTEDPGATDDLWLEGTDDGCGARITLGDLDAPVGTPALERLRLARGSLVELSGPVGCGKTELVLKLLARHTELTRIGWIEERWSAYPPALAARGVALSRLLCCDTQGDAELSHWTALQLLRSGLFGAVVLSISFSRKREERQVQLRRLQLAAERSRTTAFLLHETPLQEGTWAITHRLAVRRAPESERAQLRGIEKKNPS